MEKEGKRMKVKDSPDVTIRCAKNGIIVGTGRKGVVVSERVFTDFVELCAFLREHIVEEEKKEK